MSLFCLHFWRIFSLVIEILPENLLSFSTWKMSFYGLLDSIISTGKAAVSIILASLKVKFLLAFNIFFVFVFSILTMMCSSMFFFVFRSSSFWNMRLMVFGQFWKRMPPLSHQMLLPSTSLSLFTHQHSDVRCFHKILCVSYSFICFSQHLCSPCFCLIFSISPSSSSLILSSGIRNTLLNTSITIL